MKLEEILSSRDKVIHCDTLEKAKLLCEKLSANGFTWVDRTPITTITKNNNNWELYKNNTCYGISEICDCIFLCDYLNCLNNKYGEPIEVVEFDDLDDFKPKSKVLDDVEFKYLLGVIKPFMRDVRDIQKWQHTNTSKEKECIIIHMKDKTDTAELPYFPAGTMYKRMEAEKLYTLEELGFVKPKPTLDFKFKVDDLVKITNGGKLYSTYDEWFEENNCEYLKENYAYNLGINEERDYVVAAFGGHSSFKGVKIYAIKDILGRIFLIGEGGIEKEGH